MVINWDEEVQCDSQDVIWEMMIRQQEEVMNESNKKQLEEGEKDLAHAPDNLPSSTTGDRTPSDYISCGKDESAYLTGARARRWSETAPQYIHYFEPLTLSIGCTLLTNMEMRYIRQPLRVLESGCGAGSLAIEIFRLLLSEQTTGHFLSLIDLSDAMIDVARSRLEEFKSRATINFAVGDATSLPYSNNSFDRYICNMTLHFASDPDAWLRESARVLTKGGISGFTVWGRKERSPVMTIFPEAKRKLGIESPPPVICPFEFGGCRHDIRRRVLDAGFVECAVWYAPTAFEAFSGERFFETMVEGAYTTKEEIIGLPDDVRKSFKNEVVKMSENILAHGNPLCLDVCYIIARK